MTPSRNREDLAGFDFVMPKQMYELLKRKARAVGMTRSEFLRRVVARELGNERLAEMPRTIGQKLGSRESA